MSESSPSPSAKPTLLKVSNLTKRFPGVLANDHINVDIRKGEIHCLLGENGAGKSTLAECIYGYYQPDEGEIHFKGEKVEITSPHEAIDLGIGMVHQHFVLVSPFTVVENVALGLDNSGILLDLEHVENKLHELCKEYDIELDLQAKISQLSVGEQQWVEILKALYTGVDLLILDEPTAVLTPQETAKFFTILTKMTLEGLGIIFITHKLKEVMELSDRVTVLRKGQFIDTVETKDVTRADLARMMVGREVVFRVEKEKVEQGEPILEVENLWALNDRGRNALEGVTFTLHRNEILGLAGVAGNGQKELIETLVGVRKATQGEIRIEGEIITHNSPHDVMSRGLAHIPDDRIREGLVTEFSVAQNLMLGQQRDPPFRKGLFLDSDQIEKHAQACVDAFEVATPTLDSKTKFLSGGNLQKLILARELAMQPKVLLANQPTRGLDVGVIEYVWQQLLEKRRDGDAILLASEDLDEILNLADRVMVICQGRIMDIFDIKDVKVEEIGLLMAGIEDAEC
jgi:general nucleoside transport system ATP-binding protein